MAIDQAAVANRRARGLEHEASVRTALIELVAAVEEATDVQPSARIYAALAAAREVMR